MTLINFILNIAGLLLWLNWRTVQFEPSVRNPAAWLAGTLRRAEAGSLRRWHFLLALALLLGVRALFYWQIGQAVHWTPSLHLGPITIFFRGHLLSRLLLFSALSFLLALGVFYQCLLLLSLVNNTASETDPFQKLIRAQLGFCDALPWPVKLALPAIIASLGWCLAGSLLSSLDIIPPVLSRVHRLEQAIVLGLGSYLVWKLPFGIALALYVLDSYIYLGKQAFWSFVGLTGRRLVMPLRWLPLRAGRFDLVPFLELALVFFGAGFADGGLTALYARLPL